MANPFISGIFFNNGSLHRLNWPRKEPLSAQIMVSQNDLAFAIAEAKEKERKLIGQELHDNVNQILTTVKLFMEMLRPADSRDRTIREKSIQYLLICIEEIRRISGELVKSSHHEKGLTNAIKTILDDIQFSTPIKFNFKYNDEVESLDFEKKTNLLRIVQEQLKNVIKHSKATLVTIGLFLHQDEVTLVIKDNGIGFDAKEVRDGVGLYNIYDRVQSHHGSVMLQTAKGDGCSLSDSIPRLDSLA